MPRFMDAPRCLGRGFRRPRAIGRPPARRPMRSAATTAQAVIAPTSTKVSWNACTGSAGCACRRHSSTMPTRLMPTAPPSWRMKLIVLAPCEMKPSGRPRIAPRLSDGSTKPRPMRPIDGHSVISHSAVARPTVIISANDAASSSSPVATMRLTGSRSARRPASGIVSASTMPAGSSTAPACDGGRCSATCMNTGTR